MDTQGSLSFQDILKNSAVENFGTSGDLSPLQLLLGLVLAFAVGLFIFYIYKRTFNGVLYSRNFNVSLVLLTLVSTMIIRCITSNLALSLGMVGALSIVRFRTAVKDPMDTVFMFWAVGVGIMFGAGFYTMGLVGSAIIGIFLFIMFVSRSGKSTAYLLVVRHDLTCSNEVDHMLGRLPKGARLKSKTITHNGVEVTTEIRLSDGDSGQIINQFTGIGGVFDASLISYQGDYGA